MQFVGIYNSRVVAERLHTRNMAYYIEWFVVGVRFCDIQQPEGLWSISEGTRR